MKILHLLGLAIATASMSGCALGGLTATNISKPLNNSSAKAGEPSAVFVDAKQRAVFTGTARGETKERDQTIVCPEPSPDVFSAMAARAGLSVTGLSKGIAADGGLSETAANIGLRTQTITLLRDSNFQPCLSRLNGSDQVQYDMMMRRSQNNIAGLLAIEQLTGAVRGANAALAAGAGTSLNMKEFYTLQAASADAEKGKVDGEIEALDAEKSTLDEETTSCKEDDKTGKCTPEERDARKARLKVIPVSKKSLQDRSKSLEARQKAYTTLASDAKEPEPGAAASLTSTPDSISAMAGVASVVKDITLSMINRDYSLQMCFDYARNAKLGVSGAEAAKTFCDNIMTQAAAVRQADVNLMNANATARTAVAGTFQAALLEAVRDGTVSAKESALLDKLLGYLTSTAVAEAGEGSDSTTYTMEKLDTRWNNLDVPFWLRDVITHDHD